jgi:hypothetical protein
MPRRPEDTAGTGGGHDVSRPGEEASEAVEGTRRGQRFGPETEPPRPRGAGAGRLTAHGGGRKERSGRR